MCHRLVAHIVTTKASSRIEKPELGRCHRHLGGLAALRARHPGHPAVDERLELEEVQVLQRPLHPVRHRLVGTTAGRTGQPLGCARHGKWIARAHPDGTTPCPPPTAGSAPKHDSHPRHRRSTTNALEPIFSITSHLCSSAEHVLLSVIRRLASGGGGGTFRLNFPVGKPHNSCLCEEFTPLTLPASK